MNLRSRIRIRPKLAALAQSLAESLGSGFYCRLLLDAPEEGGLLQMPRAVMEHIASAQPAPSWRRRTSAGHNRGFPRLGWWGMGLLVCLILIAVTSLSDWELRDGEGQEANEESQETRGHTHTRIRGVTGPVQKRSRCVAGDVHPWGGIGEQGKSKQWGKLLWL